VYVGLRPDPDIVVLIGVGAGATPTIEGVMRVVVFAVFTSLVKVTVHGPVRLL
jgi:hypothetical protein